MSGISPSLTPGFSPLNFKFHPKILPFFPPKTSPFLPQTPGFFSPNFFGDISQFFFFFFRIFPAKKILGIPSPGPCRLCPPGGPGRLRGRTAPGGIWDPPGGTGGQRSKVTTPKFGRGERLKVTTPTFGRGQRLKVRPSKFGKGQSHDPPKLGMGQRSSPKIWERSKAIAQNWGGVKGHVPKIGEGSKVMTPKLGNVNSQRQ